jgi:hypothetical protein
MILDVYYQAGIFSLLCIIITLATPFILYNSFKNNTIKAIRRNLPVIIIILIGMTIFSQIGETESKILNSQLLLLKYVTIPFIFMILCSVNMDLAFKKKILGDNK